MISDVRSLQPDGAGPVWLEIFGLKDPPPGPGVQHRAELGGDCRSRACGPAPTAVPAAALQPQTIVAVLEG